MIRTALLLLGVFVALPVFADEGSDFVSAFAAATNTKDRKAWEAFLSPGSRACLSGPGKKILDQIFVKDTSQPVTPDSKVYVTPLTSTEVLLFEDMLTYPDRPTHYFQINLGSPEKMTGALIRYGRLQGGKWQYVLGCPKAGAIAEFESSDMKSGGGPISKATAKPPEREKPVRRSRSNVDARECLNHEDIKAVMKCAEKFR